MHDSITDLTNIAIVATVAVILGFGFMRLRQPPIVGYIIAGLVLGPTGLGFVSHSPSISLLAELGVLMLLFIIGMELSIRAFTMVLRPAVIIVLGQLAAAFAITATFGYILQWRFEQMLVLAFIVALSSTAVAIKVLEEIGELRTETGRITIGIMIAQDLAVVPILILTTALGEGEVSSDVLGWSLFFKVALAVGGLAILLTFLARPGKYRLPFTDLVHDRHDVIALAMIAFCFSAAALSGLAGLSAAYGAFVAGLIVSSSTLRSEAITVTAPIQSILVFIFFLSVGLLLDLNYVRDNWQVVTLFATGVILAKTVLNILLVRYSGFGWDIALPAGLATAQIGEFSFILAAAALSSRVLDHDTYRLALSVIAVTLIVSPIWMTTARRFHDVARTGIMDFRTALAETYADELSEIEKGARRLAHYGRRTRRYVRATRRTVAVNIERRRRAKIQPEPHDDSKASADKRKLETDLMDSGKTSSKSEK